MLIIAASRNGDGVTLALPHDERQKFPEGATRIFIAIEYEERSLELGKILNDLQARAAASILTKNECGAQEKLRFVDPVSGDELLDVEPWMTPQL